MTPIPALIFFLLFMVTWFIPDAVLANDTADVTDNREQDVESLRMQLQSDPANTALKYELARQYNFSGRYQEAIELFDELLKINANNADYLLGIGQSYLWSDRAETSIGYLQKAAQIAPDYEDVQRALAQAYRNSGQPEKANAVYRDALTRFDRPDWAVTGLQTAPSRDYPEFGLQLSQHMEDLDYSPDNWRRSRLALTGYYTDKSFTVFAEDSEHFELDDKTFGASATLPLFEKSWIVTEVALSPTHRFAPEYSLYAQLGHSLDGGWGLLAGIRHREYPDSTVNIINATLEKYLGSFRVAYTLFASDSDTAGSAMSHRVQAGYYFAEENSVQIAVTTGEEVEKITDSNQIIRTEFTNVSLWGEYWLTQNFALEYGIGYTDLNLPVQGDTHRKHIQLGIDYRF